MRRFFFYSYRWGMSDQICLWGIGSEVANQHEQNFNFDSRTGEWHFLYCNHLNQIILQGNLLIFCLVYLETFLFELLLYTIFPCVVLYRSRENYHQIWTQGIAQQVWKINLENDLRELCQLVPTLCQFKTILNFLIFTFLS